MSDVDVRPVAPRALARLLAALLAVVTLAGCGTDDDPGDGPVTTPDGFSRLDDRSLGPVVGGARSPAVSLTLLAPHGTEEVRTSTFSAAFDAAGQDADYLTWFEVYDAADTADAALRTAVRHWGLEEGDRRGWLEDLRLAGSRKVRRSTTPVESPSGLVVQLTLRASADGGQTHQYTVTLGEDLYTPQALAELRRTGHLPLRR